MSEELLSYGYKENKDFKNPFGIKVFSADNDHTAVLDCDSMFVKDVIADVKRHVDGVDYIAHRDNSDRAYTTPNTTDPEVFFTDYTDAVMDVLDPEGELESLLIPFTITVSSRPDDIDKKDTDRTLYRFSSMKEVVDILLRQPYITRFGTGFSEEQKKDLFELSLRIQKAKGLPEETRKIDFKDEAI